MVHVKQGVYIILVGCALGLLFNMVNPNGVNINTHDPFPDAKKTAEAAGIKTVGMDEMAGLIKPSSGGAPAILPVGPASDGKAPVTPSIGPAVPPGGTAPPPASGGPAISPTPGREGVIKPQEEFMHLDKAATQSNLGAVFVDARTPELFAKGRIPFAINLPENRFDEYWASFAQMNIPKNQNIVVYCDGQACLASNKVADLLRRKGYTQVMVFFGGWEEWRAANAKEPARYPIEFD